VFQPNLSNNSVVILHVNMEQFTTCILHFALASTLSNTTLKLIYSVKQRLTIYHPHPPIWASDSALLLTLCTLQMFYCRFNYF